MNIIAELKRRNVFRAATFYAASAWLLVQIATQVFPFFGISEHVMRWIVVAAVIGFPFAMAFSWLYEWTPDGIQRESAVATDASVARETRHKLDRWIIAVLAAATVLLLVYTFVLHRNIGSGIDKSIAVLPFENNSTDAGEQYFSDGLTEDLIGALSQFKELKVISRNSSFRFRGSKQDSKTIGWTLGAAHLLQGSVRRVEGRVRVIVELINAADGSMLWSQRYDRPFADVFAVQDEITGAVSDALQTQLLSGPDAVASNDRPPNGNLAAYNAYLQGRFYEARNTELDFRRAIDYYKQAIGIDPGYALAHAALSLVSTNLAARFLAEDDAKPIYRQARTDAEAALSLDANLAIAHLARGRLLLLEDFDWSGAEAEYRRALQLAPGSARAKSTLGNLLATLGHLDQAVMLTREALEIDPLNARDNHLLATYLMALGRLDEAQQTLHQAIGLQPEMLGNHEQLTIIEILRGDAASARRAAQQETPGDWQDAAMARALQVGPDRAAADAALAKVIANQAGKAAYQIAQLYALRKEPDRVFEWLDRAWTTRDSGVGLLLYDPLMQAYRDDPRFAAFCRKVGLPFSAAVARRSVHGIGPTNDAVAPVRTP